MMLVGWLDKPVSTVLLPRSRLYHLAPIGIGTADVESLTSYISRLAEAHAVTVGRLMMDEILPRLGRAHLIDEKRGASGPQAWRTRMHVINGMSPLAGDTVATLEALTGRRDLRWLTMLPWKDALSPRGLLRRTRTWCPTCLCARRRQGQVYESLTWMLLPIKVCAQHRVPLQDRCSARGCGRTQPALIARTRPGHCAWCGGWLGTVSHGECDPKLCRWYRWRAATVGRLVGHEPSQPFEPSLERLPRMLGEIGAYVGLRQLAIDGQISRQTLGLWRAGKARPTLEMFLRLTYCLERSGPYAALMRPLGETRRSLAPVISTALPSGRATYRRFDRAATSAILKAALADPGAPSLTAVAHQSGYRRSRLRMAFPVLCTAVANRYERVRKNNIRIQRADLRAKIHAAESRLRADGIYPGMDRVAAVLRVPRLRVWRMMRKLRGHG